MRNNFIIKCIYNGSKEYKPKDPNKDTVILHEFLDSFGESYCITDHFIGEKGKPYLLNLRIGDLRKEGTYTKYWKIAPLTVNDLRKEPVKKEG